MISQIVWRYSWSWLVFKWIKPFLKGALHFVLSLQLIWGTSAYASEGLDFDFSNEGSVVTNGPDRGEQRDDGNCVGSGCGDHGGGRGEDDRNGPYDDFNRDHGREEGSDSRGNDRGERDSSESIESTAQGSGFHGIDFAVIASQDRDNKDGIFYVKDRQGLVYYRGLGIDDASNKFNDVYTRYERNGTRVRFVKSADGKELLELNGLEECAQFANCEGYGYREDWWNYSYGPDLNAERADKYQDRVAFAQKQLFIKKEIDRADVRYATQSVQHKVVEAAKSFHWEANRAFARNNISEAQAYQEGAVELLSTIIDVGISLTPLSWGKDAYELITGKSLVAGRALTRGERMIAAAGVVLPGVIALSVAGLHLVKSLKAGQRVIQNAAKAEEAIAAFGSMKVARFREGKNLSEVAVIGRDMTSVRAASARLNAAGIETRVFEDSMTAKAAFLEKAKEFPGKIIPYDKVPSTATYRENMDWIKKVIKDDISVIDIGNPRALKERSRFYDDEVRTVFKEVNKL